MKYKALGIIGAVLLVLLTAPSTLGQTTTGVEITQPPRVPGIIWWPYIWWNPSVIFAGSVTHLHAGIQVISRSSLSYSIRVVIYDPYPDRNFPPPLIVSHSLVGCGIGRPNIIYDPRIRAWVINSGECFVRGGYISGNFGITARWQPRVAGTYRAEVTACVNEPLGRRCESRSATLFVRTVHLGPLR